MDTKKRSWAKSLTWRVIGIVILGGIAYLIIGNWKEMTTITILFHGIRLVLYYFHERFWERISWGRLKHPLSDLPVKGKLTPNDFQIIAERVNYPD